MKESSLISNLPYLPLLYHSCGRLVNWEDLKIIIIVLYFIYIYIYIYIFNLFIFGCIGPLILRADSLQLWWAGATLRCGAQDSHCGGFSCWGAQALGTWASAVVARGLSSCGSQALDRRLSSCGAQAQPLHGMWDPPGPGLEPVSPALAGGPLTTAPPGKSLYYIL